MAYTAWSVVYGEQPTAAKWNQLGQNDAGFKDGTNIDNAAIKKEHLEAGLNTISDYSTSEKATEYTWIDGKTIYKKTINFGTLPNTTTKNVAHGISGIDKIILMEGAATDGTLTIPIPYPNPSSSSSIALFRDGADISIITASNRSAYTYCYITIFYTKV